MGIFEDKVAIITGGASGIGRALGEELARRGARIILADVNEALLKETTESISKAGFHAKAAILDVTDSEAFEKLVSDTVTEYGRLDYLFNNAGIAVVGETEKFSRDDWHSVIDTNLYGVVHGVAAAYPLMVKQGFGHIINTASAAGLIPTPGEISYTASKYGVVGLSHVLRVEGADLGVRVSVVCPGFIETPIFYNAKLIGMDRQTVLESLPKTTPANECARAILRGVERNKATIIVTPLAKVICFLYRMIPSIMMRVGRRYARQMREMSGKA